MQQQQFLAKLAEEAKLQAKIKKTKVIPANFESVAGFFASHVWQILLSLSFLLALIREVHWS